MTRVFGPIVSYNLVCLFSPALAGWSAFILCRHVAGRQWPALFGGLFFAFSPYVLSRMLGNVDLTLMWPIPLSTYAALRRIDGSLGVRGFAAALAILIAAQFLLFAEIVAGATLFGAFALVLAAPAMGPPERRRLFLAAALAAAAYVPAAILVAPYLYYMFVQPTAPGQIFTPWHFAIDFANLMVPTGVNQLGFAPFFAPIACRFRAELSESGACRALPTIAIMYFRMAEGYVTFAPPVPREQSRWSIIESLYQLRGVPPAGDQFKAYVESHDAGAVNVGPRRHYRVGSIDGPPTAAPWMRAPTLATERDATAAMLDSLDVPAVAAGCVTIYRLTPPALAQSRADTALAMEQRAQQTRFEALVFGAERYLDGGGNLALLSVERAQQLGLLPLEWCDGTLAGSHDTNPIFHSTVLLGPAGAEGIEVGLEDSYPALEPIIRRNGPASARIYFPYPAPLTAGSTPRGPAILVIVFDRVGLARAAASAARKP